MSKAQDHSALRWIKGELDATLQQASGALQEYAEGSGDRDLLETCSSKLHQVYGTLQMIQLYGPAMLAEEMEQVSRAMFDSRVRDPEEASESLMMALIQLPDYLEKLQADERDIPLVILPLLNDLRATRDAPLLSEASLFTPVLDASLLPDQVTGEANEALAEIAKRSRRDYHKGLLGWYTNQASEQSLGRLRGVIEELQRHATTQPVFELFWAAHGLTAGLLEGSLTTGSAIKSLFGKLDREIKRLIDFGEDLIARGADRDLLKNILYYVAQADSQDPVVNALQKAYQLDAALPTAQEVADGRARLSAPNADVLDTVREVIKSDLTQIKDNLDLYIRGDRAQLGQLVALQAPMRKLADTLGMVGQGSARVRLNRQADGLEDLAASNTPPDDNELMEIAGDLLFVETSLSNVGKMGAAQSSNADDLSVAGAGSLLLPEGELNKLVDATLQEARIDLGKVKEAIIAFIESPDVPDVLSEVRSKFHNVGGALRMLSLAEPAGMLDAIGAYVDTEFRGRGRLPEEGQLDALADAITSIEYFIESVLDGNANRDDILASTREALGKLGLDTGATEAQQAPVLTVVEKVPVDEPLEELEPQLRVDAAEMSPDAIGAHEEVAELVHDSGSEAVGFSDEIDPEIREIFIEEAQDELATIKELLPRWHRNPNDLEALNRFRRSFHTLKGSGRLVGANSIGELSWSIENVLNRVIDGRLDVTPEIPALLEETLQLLPRLIEQLNTGGAAVAGVRELMDRSVAVAGTQQPDTIAEGSLASIEPLQTVPAVAERTAEQPSEEQEPVLESASEAESVLPPAEVVMEPELLEIFREETASHLQVLEDFIRPFRDHRQPQPISEKLFRALHTLRGSANMADAGPIGSVGKGLEKLVSAMAEMGAAADAEVIALLEQGGAKIREQLELINVPGVPFPDGEALVARADKLREQKLAEVVAEAQVPGIPVERVDQVPLHEVPELDAERIEEAAADTDIVVEPRVEVVEGPPVERVEEPPLEVVEEQTDQFEVTGDGDLVEIFLEEARDLCDQLDIGLQRWRQNTDQQAPLAELQRSLHTLKGGARLAGVSPVGDLSHALESLLTSVAAGQLVVTDDLKSLAQQVVDRLSAQVDEVGVSGSVHLADDLIAQLDARLKAMPEAVGEEPPAIETADADTPAVGEAQTEQAKDQPETADASRLPEPESAPVHERLSATGQVQSEKSRVVESEPAESESRETPGGPILPAALPPKFAVQAKQQDAKLPPKREHIRVRSDLLDRLVNNAGEVSIYRARMEQQNSSIGFHLSELEQTVTRLRQQLRQMDLENEAQILFRYEREKEEQGTDAEEFDPLELDRFSTMQQLSRSLMETVSDLVSIKDITEDLHREMETLLMQQSRVSTDLQDGLLRTRMVPFGQVISRLQRLVRQTCSSMNKRARLTVNGAQVEVDRNILERMVAPLEHILRNAVSHGIELPEVRQAGGKPEQGEISLDLSREGTDVVLTIADDGQGLNLANIRRRAIDRGLLAEEAQVSDSDIMQFVLEPGFSTADEVTQIAGRGVGMDVVSSEVKQISGSLEIASEQGKGSKFTIRLPLTLAISEALLVQMEDEIYAVPHTSIEGVVRIGRDELQACYEGRQEGFEYAGHTYRVRYLGNMLGIGAISLPEGKKWFPMLLVRSGDRRVALQVEGLLGNRQIVVKSVGPQLSSVRWITGGTILGDGRVALILDVNALVRMDAAKPLAPVDTGPSLVTGKAGVKVMVVDDSITVRKVTGRLLERHNFQVMTAKDGVDAVAQLQEQLPDVMLLDIEMPRMDGFELARHIRNSPDLQHIPIIMITSRTGEKHRNLAKELGVKRYLGKPYQEMDLLDNIYSILAEAQV